MKLAKLHPFLTHTAAAIGLIGALGAHAATPSIADFEDGLPSGWTTAGNAWSVVTQAGASVHIPPGEGSRFAISGAPGAPSESFTGTLTSGPLKASFESLQWLATGWAGQFGNGANRYEILDGNQAVVGSIAAPLSDSWSTQTFNLAAAGFHGGDTFYFRVVDSDTNAGGNGYAWLAVDGLKFSGAAMPVPEPASCALLAAGLGLISLRMQKRPA